MPLPSTVGSTTVDGIDDNFQRKQFYAATRWWIFYSNGTNFGWSSSADDGETWNAFQVLVASNRGYPWSLWFDGTYVNLTRQYILDSYVYYRRGTPLSDGNITWEAWRTVSSTAYVKSYGSITKDSDGYPWVAYSDFTSGSYRPRVQKATALDGSTWGAYTELDSTDGTGMVCILPLSEGKMFCIWCFYTPTLGSRQLRAKFYNGSSWESLITITTNVNSYSNWSAIVANDVVGIFFQEGTSNHLHFINWTESEGLGSEEDVETIEVYTGQAPTISKSGNYFYAIWPYSSDGTTKIYWRKRSGEIWGSKQTFVASGEISISKTETPQESYDAKIAVAWNNGSAIRWSRFIIGETVVLNLGAGEIYATQARMFGYISSIGIQSFITKRGFEWGETYGLYPNSWAEDDSFSIGSFEYNGGTFEPGHVYYFRAFAYNGDYIYSEVKSFETANIPLPCEVIKGWQAKIYKNGILLDFCDHVSLNIDSNLESYFEVGKRKTKLFKEKEQRITGSIGRFHKDRTLLDLATPSGLTMPKFDLLILTAPIVGKPAIYLYNCFLTEAKIDYKVDDSLKEEFSFIATSIVTIEYIGD